MESESRLKGKLINVPCHFIDMDSVFIFVHGPEIVMSVFPLYTRFQNNVVVLLMK